MPVSIAACSSCAKAPYPLGWSNAVRRGTTHDGETRTLSRWTVPLAVVRCPTASQSSLIEMPSTSAGRNTT